MAVRCAEGIVLATDSQATAQLAGGMPVKQDANKLEQLTDHILFAGTGAQGCSQRVAAYLASVDRQQLAPSLTRHQIASVIHQYANVVQKQSQNAFVQYTSQAQAESWGGIFCGQASDGPWIMEIDLNGGWQFHDSVAATGSGYALAFHAIASVQHYDVPNQSLLAAKLIAYRAIETTCTVSAYGVGLPVQMGVVLESGASRLSPDEIAELEELLNLWKAKEVETLGAALAPKAQPSGISAEAPATPQAAEGLRPPDAPHATSEGEGSTEPHVVRNGETSGEREPIEPPGGTQPEEAAEPRQGTESQKVTEPSMATDAVAGDEAP